MLLLTGDDPWFELPIPSSILETHPGASLEIELGWPMSADYLALSQVVRPLQSQLEEAAAAQDRWNHQRSELEKDIQQDRKSTRLNSSHLVISYAVFCLQ